MSAAALFVPTPLPVPPDALTDDIVIMFCFIRPLVELPPRFKPVERLEAALDSDAVACVALAWPPLFKPPIGLSDCELMFIICGILFVCDETSLTTVGLDDVLN